MKKYSTSTAPWSVSDNPLGKLVSAGHRGLSDVELVSLLLQVGSNADDARSLAKEILQDNKNSLAALRRLSVDEWMSYKGIGAHRAAMLVAALEVGRRANFEAPEERIKISQSQNAFDIFRAHGLDDLAHEEFWCIFLDRSNKVISTVQISSGGQSATIVDMKVLFQRALAAGAQGVVPCHNHPSKQAFPSQADISTTKKAVAAGELLDIAVLDHIIVAGGNSYYSFADQGMI